MKAPEAQTSQSNLSKAAANQQFGKNCVSAFSPYSKFELQPKLTINQPNDAYEQEADSVADKVMRMTSSDIQTKPLSISGIQRKCAHCEAEEKNMQRKTFNNATETTDNDFENYVGNLSSGGQSLPDNVLSFYEPRFGYNFSNVKVHTDSVAAKSAQSINALAYTSGNNIVFNQGQYSPNSDNGKRLLAHELTHVVQQSSDIQTKKIQRTIGDGHDLAAPAFAGDVILEAVFDGERLIQSGSSGAHVRKLQQSLLEMGYNLPNAGVDGDFGPETKAAIERFQRDAGAAHIDGIVGPETMQLFDQHDTSGTLGPVATTGPLPGPRAASNCDNNFNGVTFTLANQVAAGATPAANMFVSGGSLLLQSTAVANYQPHITIAAPNNAKAQEFEVGFVQNLLSENLVYTYSNGTRVRSLMPTPIKDGLARTALAAGGGGYNAIFVSDQTASIVEAFTTNGDTRNLTWPDTPSDSSPVNLNNTICPFDPTATITNAVFNDRFRVWTVVRHIPSGCVHSLHHMDWELNLEATVANAGGAFNVTPVHNEIIINTADGDGKPGFIQGGAVANDFVALRGCA